MNYWSILQHINDFLEKTVANKANLKLVRDDSTWHVYKKQEATRTVTRGFFKTKTIIEPYITLCPLLRVTRGGYQSFYVNSLTAEWDVIAKQIATKISAYGSDVDLTLWKPKVIEEKKT